MKITHNGEFTVPRNGVEVYEFLTDPRRFAPLLPYFKDLEVKDERDFVVKLKVGVSHIRGTATVKLSLAERQPHGRAYYKGIGTMAGGSVNLAAGFNLQEVDAGTCVKWEGEAQIFGKIASVARGLLEPLTKKNIQSLIDSLQKSIVAEKTGPSGGPSGPTAPGGPGGPAGGGMPGSGGTLP